MHDYVRMCPCFQTVDYQAMCCQACVCVYFQICTDCSYANLIETFVANLIIIRSMFAASCYTDLTAATVELYCIRCNAHSNLLKACTIQKLVMSMLSVYFRLASHAKSVYCVAGVENLHSVYTRTSLIGSHFRF